MKIIGITGGVGAGKSTVLEYLQSKYKVRILIADSIAHQLMAKGQPCYEKIGRLFGNGIFNESMNIDREKLGELIFKDEENRRQVNSIVHPAVKEYITDEIRKEVSLDIVDYVVVEAALLIEDHYGEICDELWYIHCPADKRRQRLKKSRKYSDEKVDQMFASQLDEMSFRKNCNVTINNDKAEEDLYKEVDAALKHKEGNMILETDTEDRQLVFGLDIGTRNVVGTVGYRGEDDKFYVAAQYVREHDTRAMIDGQIHDIIKVGKTLNAVREELEKQIGQKLTDVCIAAAGRVLKTVTTSVEYEFPTETVINGEHIHTLDLLGIEKAQQELNENNDTKFTFYCVGYTVIKYFLNDDLMSNLESHKAKKISEEIIVTFLPEDVVDGLYAAVGLAGLEVANLTLEPIAAINVAIPEAFRMLNIALVDVGAGTSDICITRDGSIIAYGMIPFAGDEITELLVHHYLIDFKTAEQVKLAAGQGETISYKDIMNIPHEVEPEEIWELTEPVVEKIAGEVSGKIRELNGGRSVSAVFVVGGGGKIHGFVENIAKELDLPPERVALRGEEVLQEVEFLQKDIKKDPLIVTPIGICLNYYDKRNSFIFVYFNGERIKLYDNSKLTVVDAAMQAGFPNEALFPKRGKELTFVLNGKQRMINGEMGEAAVVTVNGQTVDLSTPLASNINIQVRESTQGKDASCTIHGLPEYKDAITFVVNGTTIHCPRLVEVNKRQQSEYYEIRNNDEIEVLNYYTVEQLIKYMDLDVDYASPIFVNNKSVELSEKVFENFYMDATLMADRAKKEAFASQSRSAASAAKEQEPPQPQEPPTRKVTVMVNNKPVTLTGKDRYIFVDVFDKINFDLKNPGGRNVVTLLNGENSQFNEELKTGDKLDIYWQD